MPMDSYSLIQPNSILRPFVKYYWTLKADALIHEVSQRVVPTGLPSLVFHRGNSLYSTAQNDFQPQHLICGQSLSFTDVTAANGSVDMISVSFYPSGLKAFFKMPVSEFKEENVALDNLDDKGLMVLADKVKNTNNSRDAIFLIEQFLISRLKSFDTYNYRRIASVVDFINYNQESNIMELADIACLSYKQFGRVFAEYIGSSPKEFTRIIRFQRALHILENREGIGFAELAVECNYYDQSHLIREFKAFSGYTPAEYLALCKPHSDYFSNY